MTGPTPGQGGADIPSGSDRLQISDNTESRVRGALDDVRAKALTLTNYCDFVGRYIQAHRDYRDLLDVQNPGHVLDG